MQYRYMELQSTRITRRWALCELLCREQEHDLNRGTGEKCVLVCAVQVLEPCTYNIKHAYVHVTDKQRSNTYVDTSLVVSKMAPYSAPRLLVRLQEAWSPPAVLLLPGTLLRNCSSLWHWDEVRSLILSPWPTLNHSDTYRNGYLSVLL